MSATRGYLTLNAIAELNDHVDRSLLIVEDDKPFLERLSRAMETRGFAVTSCDTVSDGLAQSHMVKVPPRAPAPDASQRISWRAERRAQKII